MKQKCDENLDKISNFDIFQSSESSNFKLKFRSLFDFDKSFISMIIAFIGI